MKKIPLLLSLLMSSPLWAQTIDVKYGFNIFTIKKDENEISFQKKEFLHTTRKEACSEKLFNMYVKEVITPILEGKYTSKNSGSEFLVEFKIDGKEGVLPDTDPFAKKLLSIPSSYDQFRLSTEFRCKKK